MDAAFSITRLSEDFAALLDSADFEGAEELMLGAVAAAPRYESYIHFQMGRLYVRWNKMSSAVNHLNRAVELAAANSDEIFMLQVVDELRRAKELRASQQP